MWGDWKDTTGRCSKTCGVGLDAGRKEQRREIIQRNENGGNACGNKDTRYVNCNARKCPGNLCKLLLPITKLTKMNRNIAHKNMKM